MTESRDLPPGVELRARIPFDSLGGDAYSVEWSPDGQHLAASNSSGVSIWAMSDLAEVEQPVLILPPASEHGNRIVAWSRGNRPVILVADNAAISAHLLRSAGDAAHEWWSRPYSVHGGALPAVSFSPGGTKFACVEGHETLTFCRTSTGKVERSCPLPVGGDVIAWSPADDRIAIASGLGEVIILTVDDFGTSVVQFPTKARLPWVRWSPDGGFLCVIRATPAITIHDANGVLVATLEGHTGDVKAIDFSRDGRLLYTVGSDATIRCWRSGSWECVAVIPIDDDHGAYGGFAAAPHADLLARRSADRDRIEIYEVDVDLLLAAATTDSRTYANAKVVLVGDTGVGKSGLGLVLSDQKYRATDSTHARQVFLFDEQVADRPGGGSEKREILLWDLAGQPGYRLIHQLHLSEAAAALLVFDARSESDPFAGVRYWARVLKQYRNTHADQRPQAILVAARVDRGGIPASRDRVLALCVDLGLTGYFETSAKEGRQIPELAEAIRAAIDWDALPRSVSNELFETIKRFLLAEKDSEQVLATCDALYRAFLQAHPGLAAGAALRPGFDTCVRLLEGRDLLRRLSFGGFVLLRPELLDSYASALIDAARGQPDGLGYLAEEDVLAGRFPIPSEERLAGPPERLLLIATVEEMFRYDLALREITDSRVDLVFPSQFTAGREAPADSSADVIFRFEGSVATLYATLAVRLSHVAAYRRDEMWHNCSTYRAKVGGVCGLRVREHDDGRGELTVFFDAEASEETRFTFEDYVRAHITRHALPDSVVRERIFTCPGCAYRIDAELVRRKLALGATGMTCPVCEQERILLLDREDRLGPAAARSVREMNESADAGRDRAAATATLRGKETTHDFDVFLSYNTAEREAVAGIAEGLRAEGLLPWFDTRDLAPGREWQDELARQIRGVRAAAVFVGPAGLGGWQKLEVDAIVDEQTRRAGLRVIPVLLPGAPAGIDLPLFLQRFQAVDFRVAWPLPFARLVGAITDQRP